MSTDEDWIFYAIGLAVYLTGFAALIILIGPSVFLTSPLQWIFVVGAISIGFLLIQRLRGSVAD
jgi:hypothetical protein